MQFWFQFPKIFGHSVKTSSIITDVQKYNLLTNICC